ncbi:MAG: biotin carboxyl carrier protein [Pseudomonadota bacterium]
MSEIKFIDTTLRDGNQSLWDATGLTTAMILDLAPYVNGAGYHAVDFIASTHMQTAVRYHRENPWEKTRLASKAMPDCRLCFGTTGRRFVGFKRSPDSIIALVYERVAANGIARVWLCDASHEMDNVTKNAKAAKIAGIKDFMVALCYSISPVHTDEYYAEKTREITRCPDVDTIYLKDQGGLLTPETVKTLIPAIQANLNGRPLEIHTHCNTGLGPLVYLEAIRLGVDRIHTGVPPLANGTTQPSVFNVLKNIRHMGHSASLNEEEIKNYSDRLTDIAQKQGRPAGIPLEYDLAYYEHQVPGGMMTTLKRQLAEAGKPDRFGEVLEEIVSVRKDLGYPVMVTPLSQFVATQATMNIISGERYKVIPDGVIEYIAGYHGAPPAPVDQNVMDRIAGRPNTKKIMAQEFPQPSVQEIRKQMGLGPEVSDEEFLLRYALGDQEVNAMIEATGAM